MRIQTCLLHAALLFGCAAGALAMAGKLTTAGLAFPKDFPEPVRTNVLAALQRPEYHFIDGEFVNSSTLLRYDGDTQVLNSFLARLSECAGVFLSVSFYQTPGEECSWTVSHSAWGDPTRLSIQINPGSKKINLRELALPVIKGESRPKPK